MSFGGHKYSFFLGILRYGIIHLKAIGYLTLVETAKEL
jgi:hypothetical protein